MSKPLTMVEFGDGTLKVGGADVSRNAVAISLSAAVNEVPAAQIMLRGVGLDIAVPAEVTMAVLVKEDMELFEEQLPDGRKRYTARKKALIFTPN